MAEQKPPSVGSILQNIQSGLAVIAGAAALFTATGFAIVNTALAQYTDIFSYRIDAGQYVGAAISFLVLAGVPFGLASGAIVFYLFYLRSKRVITFISIILILLSFVLLFPAFGYLTSSPLVTSVLTNALLGIIFGCSWYHVAVSTPYPKTMIFIILGLCYFVIGWS